MAPSPAWLSSTIWLLQLPVFPPKAFPAAISSLTSPQAISPQSIADFTLGLLYNPYVSAPSCHMFQGLASLSGVCRATARIVCVVLTSFILSQINCCTLKQREMLPLCPKQLLRCWDLTPASFLPTPRYRYSPAHSLLFSFLPSSYQVLCGSIYFFLVVRDFCSLSADVLQDFLHLKIYSWHIHGERCTPHPPIPPPSCLQIENL